MIEANRLNNPSPFRLSDYLIDQRNIINNALKDLLDHSDQDRRIVTAMRYALMGSGKRLRPILCMAAAEAVGGQYRYVLPAACALEMIHTYSLIHDDLPGMDNDERRRGKPTCHIAFDEATAILAGDALLTLAFEILSKPTTDIDGPISNPALQLKAIRIIAQAAGYCGMIEGQMRDIQSEGQALAPNALKSLYDLKTGALICAAIETGAVMAECDPQKMANLNEYAEHIGLAFQITDDILNVEGDPERMGKDVGTDAARQKNTYPALLGLTASKALAEDLIQRALLSLESFDHRSEPLRAIARYIVERQR